VDWPVFLAHRPPGAASSLFANFAPAQSAAKSPGALAPQPEFLARVQGLPAEQARQALNEYLCLRAAQLLKIDPAQLTAAASDLAGHRLNEFGFDSLMGIEMRNRIKTELGVDVPIHRFIGGATVAQIGELIHDQLMLKTLLSSSVELDRADEDIEVITL